MEEEFDPYRPNIDSALQGGIDQFEFDVKRRYDDSEDAQVVWKFAERVAELLHDEVSGLTVKERAVTWSAIRTALAEKELDEDLTFALQARLAWHLLPSFEDVANRCWHLAELTPHAEPPEAVRRFLARVVRCYLLDFVPECLVMCRGALENAVNARFIAEGVPFPKNQDGVQTMKARLIEAEKRLWLRGIPAVQLHSEVWTRGSKAAHNDPGVVGDALGTIKLTVRALADLNPPLTQE